MRPGAPPNRRHLMWDTAPHQEIVAHQLTWKPRGGVVTVLFPGNLPPRSVELQSQTLFKEVETYVSRDDQFKAVWIQYKGQISSESDLVREIAKVNGLAASKNRDRKDLYDLHTEEVVGEKRSRVRTEGKILVYGSDFFLLTSSSDNADLRSRFFKESLNN